MLCTMLLQCSYSAFYSAFYSASLQCFLQCFFAILLYSAFYNASLQSFFTLLSTMLLYIPSLHCFLPCFFLPTFYSVSLQCFATFLNSWQIISQPWGSVCWYWSTKIMQNTLKMTLKNVDALSDWRPQRSTVLPRSPKGAQRPSKVRPSSIFEDFRTDN